ncbi:hypothetical protein [Microbacterium lushaniae]|uniref:hypothetical protein n=1 Tax=Microbacterium lushaniae TaxID=2614639 RepID=UPI001EE84AB0|nr:hypothetical protein [Microbacterium lushaniae]
MSRDAGSRGGPVAPAVALAFAVVGFVALAIAGLGLTSLILDADVIPTPGLGQIAGAIGMLLATGGFAAALWFGLRAEHPTFWTALGTAVCAYLGEIVGVAFGAVISGSGPAAGFAAAGGVAIGWPGAVIAGAGLVAGWGGIALVRTRAGRPRWPWERDEDER